MTNVKIIDFSKGSTWGRALHGSTFSGVAAESLLAKIKDKLQGAYRASVMCHYPTAPEPGDTLVWESQKGIVRAPIYRVKPCLDPGDMYTVFVRITPSCRIN